MEKKIEMEYVDINPGCYGTQKLKKRKYGFSGGCEKECRLKNECILASREEIENREHEIEKIPYDPAISSSEGNENTKGIDLDKFAARNFSSVEDFIEKFLKKNNCDPELAPQFKDILYQFAVQAHNMPKLTGVLIGKIVDGMNQSDYARRLQITRQAVSAGISTEIAGVVKSKNNLENVFSKDELSVYRLYYEQGLSLGETAEELNISKTSVYRLKQLIVRKNPELGTVKKNKTKKNGKKIRRTDRQILADYVHELEKKANAFDKIMKVGSAADQKIERKNLKWTKQQKRKFFRVLKAIRKYSENGELVE